MTTHHSSKGMRILTEKVALRGIVSAVPSRVKQNSEFMDVFDEQVIAEVSKMTGVQTRRVAGADQTTADLCEAAARQLMHDLQWESDSIDAILFISQTPDYRLPATACALQARLGLATHCAALDVNLGCSGYVYGLWLASRLIDGVAVKRVLLLVGDTTSKTVDPTDRATAMLFGDAGTATALEFSADAMASYYVLGTDGQGERNLIIPNSLYRSKSKLDVRMQNVNPDFLFMDGAEVFNFTLRSIPSLVSDVLAFADIQIDQVDQFLFHQANTFMIRHIAKKLKLPAEKVPINISRFGNTSSASIPLLISELRETQSMSGMQVMAGFGVGYSWAATVMNFDAMLSCRLIEVGEV